MGKKELIELTEWRCKQAEKRFRELAELYAADEIESTICNAKITKPIDVITNC